MKVLAGFVLALVALLAGAYLWAFSGYFPVATTSHPLPFEVSLAGRALHYASLRHAPRQVPITMDSAGLTTAAQLYRTECAFCHGLPGQPKPHAAAGMFPPPPQFFVEVDDDPAGIIFWRIKNGIRLTGMPGFAPTLSDTQIWQTALMLQQAKKLPAAAQAQLAASH